MLCHYLGFVLEVVLVGDSVRNNPSLTHEPHTHTHTHTHRNDVIEGAGNESTALSSRSPTHPERKFHCVSFALITPQGSWENSWYKDCVRSKQPPETQDETSHRPSCRNIYISAGVLFYCTIKDSAQKENTFSSVFAKARITTSAPLMVALGSE